MENFHIVRVTADRIDELQQISIQTFTETFSSMNTEENLNQYLQEAFSIDVLALELSNGNSAFHFASLGNQVAGYLKLNRGSAQNELKEENAVEIERIYILKEFQGKRIGQSLLDFAISQAKEQNAGFVWLGVWEHNLKAKKFYSKNGFVAFGRHIFRLGKDLQTDILLKLSLNQ